MTLGLSWGADHLPQGLTALVSIPNGVRDDVEGKQPRGVQQDFPIMASVALVPEFLTHEVFLALHPW